MCQKHHFASTGIYFHSKNVRGTRSKVFSTINQLSIDWVGIAKIDLIQNATKMNIHEELLLNENTGELLLFFWFQSFHYYTEGCTVEYNIDMDRITNPESGLSMIINLMKYQIRIVVGVKCKVFLQFFAFHFSFINSQFPFQVLNPLHH